MRRIAVLDAPSNLGLRPPTATSVPGCAKAPGALRDQGLLAGLGARDAGCLTPPRYDPGDWRPGDGVAHAPEIAAYSKALADRIGAILDNGEFPVVLGGDCSILIGSGIAMHRLGDAVGGRIGLVFVDGHSDFRHPGNASYVGAAAGEDLALVTGRGQADLAAIESRRPYFRDVDVVVLGIRAQDEYRLDLQAAGIVTRSVPALRAEGAARSAQWARDQLVDCAGYWVHIDVDVLDPAVMPAVDAPDPGGIAFPELELLLSGLVDSPHCLGVEITVFDPDYDPDGRYAAEITSAVVGGLAPVRNAAARPDLVAARRDLDGRQVVAMAASEAPDVVDDIEGTNDVDVAEALDLPGDIGSPGGWAELSDLAEAGEEPEPVDPEVIEPFSPVTTLDLILTSASLRWPVETYRGPAEGDDPVGFAGDDPGSGMDPAGEADIVPTVTRPADAAPDDRQEPENGDAEDGSETAAVAPASDEAEAADEAVGAAEAVEAVSAEVMKAEAEFTETVSAEVEVAETVSAEAEVVETVSAEVAEVEVTSADVEVTETDSVAAEPAVVAARPEPGRADNGVRLLSRPLGSAPLLDSEPLPATRPGLLRPRTPVDQPAASSQAPMGGFPPGAA